MWLVFISRRCDHPHHLHPGVLYKRERVLHCHLPCGHHPGHPAPAQHEESGDGGQVCLFFSLSTETLVIVIYQLSKRHLLELMKTRTQFSRFTAFHVSPVKVMFSQCCYSKTNTNRSSPQRGLYQVESCTSALLRFSSCNLLSRCLQAAMQVIRYLYQRKTAHPLLDVDLRKLGIRTVMHLNCTKIRKKGIWFNHCVYEYNSILLVWKLLKRFLATAK